VFRLEEQMERKFHFKTEKYPIPSSCPQVVLQDKLVSFEREYRSASNLLVVYYGGNGGVDEQGRTLWYWYYINYPLIIIKN
jgi:hypothetical protein